MAAMLNTALLLVAQYDGRPVIPLARLREDYFPHPTKDIHGRKRKCGDMASPVIRIEDSRKLPKLLI